MRKVLIKGITEENLEVLALKLSELGINPAPLYSSIQKNKQEAVIEIKDQDINALKSSLAGLCELIPIDETTKQQPFPIILSLFLENLLLFYILKLSLWSQDFYQLLSTLFSSSTVIAWLRLLLSLSFIALYYHVFFNSRSAPPISAFLGLNFKKDKAWLTLAYSLPLVALYLISTGYTLFKFLGLGLLSLSVAFVVYSEK